MRLDGLAASRMTKGVAEDLVEKLKKQLGYAIGTSAIKESQA